MGRVAGTSHSQGESGEASSGDNAGASEVRRRESVRDWTESFIGRVISERYRCDEAIASGGMGAVFRGEHLHMRKRLAIKVLHPETEGLPGLVAQFEREAIAGAHVSHPNVAVATDFGSLGDGSYFLILEYVDGVTLAEILKKGPLPVERAVEIAKQTAAALQAVHEKGMLHRDVKPQNIMLLRGTDDHAKLIDFGFAKVPLEQITTEGGGLLGGDKTIENPDSVFGTIGYLAPEAASGMDAVDERSDLYALGAIFYEMLSGRKPFEAASTPELFKHHRLTPVPSFGERAPGIPIPAALEALVMRMLEKSPAKRYQSGRDVIVALEQALPRSRSIRPAITIQVAPPGPRWGRRIAIVLLIGLLGGIWWYALRTRGIDVSSDGTRKEEVDGARASTWTARLLAAPAGKDWKGGAKALAALAELDPTALQNGEVAKAAAAVAADAARAPDGKATADEIFELLERRFGSEGLDTLYVLVDSKAGDASKRAMAHLRRSTAMERATPALRITVELRDAPCEFQHDLFERAGAVGDDRTSAVLAGLQKRPCARVKDPCCFAADKVLAKAIADLKARSKQ